MNRPTAIITGASRGLGRALAADLAADGWDLVIDARDADALAAVTDELYALDGSVRAVVGDVTDPSHRAELAGAARRLGRLDLLVNNAGTLGPSPLPHLRNLALDDLAELLTTNVMAPLGLIQATLPMLAQTSGSVVNVTSDAAVEAYEGWGGYGISKTALDHLGAVLAVEEPEIRWWAFDPGDMRTRMHQEAFPGEDISDRPLPETVIPALRRLLVDRPPSGRVRAVDLLETVTP